MRHADHIIVLDEGSIRERGTHEALLARRGIYFDVFATQAGLTPAEIAALDAEGGDLDGTQSL